MEAMVHVSFPVPCIVPAPYSKSSINSHYGRNSSALQEIGRSEDGSSVPIPPLGFEQNARQDCCLGVGRYTLPYAKTYYAEVFGEISKRFRDQNDI